jgi:predicted Zn-ribbon and HTH transcriptional regulator
MSKWSEYKEKNGSTPLDLLNPRTKHVTDDIEKFRLEICNSCPNLIQLTKQCKKCGCFMALKAKIEASTCPIGNW